MEIPNQPVRLAEFLEISIEALRKQMKRMGLVEGRFNRHAEMDKPTIKAVLKVYGHDEQADKLSASIETDNVKTGQSDTLNIVQSKAPKTDTAASGQADSITELDNRTTGHFSIETDKPPTGQADSITEPDNQTSGQLSIEVDKPPITPPSIETDTEPSGQLPRTIEAGYWEQQARIEASYRRSIEQSSIEKDNDLNEQPDSIKTDKQPNRQTTTPSNLNYPELTKDFLLASIALVSMYVQMNHTAAVVGGQWTEAWAYALSIQFTGLALTLYKGSLWYLRVFALAEFSINLLHYRPWACELAEGVSVCGGAEEWTRSILLSALIAFTIYSYVEIFAARRNEETDTV